jgi:hypothetical protein
MLPGYKKIFLYRNYGSQKRAKELIIESRMGNSSVTIVAISPLAKVK